MPLWMKIVALVCAVAILVGAGTFALSQKGLLASVNGQKLTQDDLTELVNYYLVTSPDIASYLSDNSFLNQVVYYLILNNFRMQEAENWNIAVSDEDVEQRYQEDLPFIKAEHLRTEGTKQQLDFDYNTLIDYTTQSVSATEIAYLESLVGTTGDALYEKALSDAKMTEDSYKRYVREELVFEALDAAILETIEVSEEEIQAQYDADKNMKYEKLGLSHILIKTVDDTQERDAETNLFPSLAADVIENKETEINSILAQLKDGADFAELANLYSEDGIVDDEDDGEDHEGHNHVDGGSLGAPMTRTDMSQYVSGFREAAQALTTVGEMTEVVKSEYGFHIIRLDSLEATPLEEVSSSIESSLRSTKATEKHKELISKAEILPADLGESMKSTGW